MIGCKERDKGSKGKLEIVGMHAKDSWIIEYDS